MEADTAFETPWEVEIETFGIHAIVCYVFNEKLLNFPASTGFYRTSPKMDIAKRPSCQSQALALCT